jgi:hypothetical protein
LASVEAGNAADTHSPQVSQQVHGALSDVSDMGMVQSAGMAEVGVDEDVDEK